MFTVCSFWAIVASCLHLPHSDLTCLLRGPLIMIPLTLMSSILVGRLWRVHKTLQVVSSMGRRGSSAAFDTPNRSLGREKSKTKRKLKLVASSVATTGEKRLMHFLSFLALSSRKKDQQHSRSFRQITTQKDTIRLIVILSLPQIILQICAACLYEWKVRIDYNEDFSIGRCVCESPDQNWTAILSVCLLVVNYCLAVLVAHFSRDLPTAFNERDQIFHVASICALIAVGALAVMAISQDTGHPNLLVSYVFS
jgi:hypothetical protein